VQMKVSYIVVCLCLLVASACGFRAASEILGDEALAIDYEIIDYVNSVQSSWKAGHNVRLSGLKVKDVKRMCGVIDMKNDLPIAEIDVGVAALPDTFDARTQWPGCVGPILDQGHCGSCWAFGAIESLSDRFCIQSKGTAKIALAPQDLTSCDGTSSGCNGGYPYLAWRYMQSTGVVTEACYPYAMGTCQHPGCSELPTPPCNKTCANGAKWASDKHFAATATQVPRNVTQIMTEIYNNGPVEGAFTVYADFNNYKSGVYIHTTGAQEGGHAIKIIGWGSDGGVDYWLVANSWNTSWGDQGFFKIRRGTNECGIEAGVVAGLAKV